MFRQFDLNLLLVFETLYAQRSVSKTADTLCISQSACSHALNRLRDALNDPLFVRINNQMMPTERANKLASYIQQAFPLLKQGLSPEGDFKPSEQAYHFRLMATDYTEYCLLPSLINHFANIAPQVKITVLPTSQQNIEQQFSQQQLDFVLGFEHDTFQSSIVEHHTWFTDKYCTIVNKHHPRIDKKLTLTQFLKENHVRIAPWGEQEGIVDVELSKLGKCRNVPLQLPSLLASPYIIEKSDYLLTLPRYVAETLCHSLNVSIFDTPLKLPQYHLNIYWHKLNRSNPALSWFISQVKRVNLNHF